MITCDICFDEKIEKDIHYMECLHYLCDNCFEKLRVNSCPFCRLEIYLKTENFENYHSNRIEINLNNLILPVLQRRNRSEIRRNKKERKRRTLLKILEEGE